MLVLAHVVGPTLAMSQSELVHVCLAKPTEAWSNREPACARVMLFSSFPVTSLSPCTFACPFAVQRMVDAGRLWESCYAAQWDDDKHQDDEHYEEGDKRRSAGRRQNDDKRTRAAPTLNGTTAPTTTHVPQQQQQRYNKKQEAGRGNAQYQTAGGGNVGAGMHSENDLQLWSTQMVSDWVGGLTQELGQDVTKYTDAMISQNVNGQVLMHLTSDDLKEIGFSVGHRILFLSRRNALINSASESSAEEDHAPRNVETPATPHFTDNLEAPPGSRPSVLSVVRCKRAGEWESERARERSMFVYQRE